MLWTRPGGSPIELQDTENLNAFAKSKGWIAEEKVKRKRRTKEEMANDNNRTSSQGSAARDSSTGQ